MARHLKGQLANLAAQDRLTDYRAHPKQAEFHAAGNAYRERLLMAGNQVGKTLAAGMEVAMHATGLYPPWWVGRTFARPTRWLAGSESAELTRKGIQRILLGDPETRQWGTGAIPKARLLRIPARQGVPDTVASISVRHVPTGGVSTIQLASYDQGRTKWQADTVDGVWLDEESPLSIYTEALARTTTTGGLVMMTFTPLFGMSEVVVRFLIERVPGTHVTQMGLEDALHISPERRAEMIQAYPAFERDARTKGIPQLGSGRVFPIDEAELSVEPFAIPAHWPQLCALDFGWDHPSAAVRMAFDRDTDCLYITACHRQREQTPAMFAASVRPWGAWLPWAWPHDGLQHDKGSGSQLAAQYRAQGLKMLGAHATFEDGTHGVEAGIAEMLDRMETARLKVFSTLRDWFEEFRMYHRKEGLIVKERDDLMAATRYAMMMRRHAIVQFVQKPAATGRSFSGGARGGSEGWMGM